MSKAMQESDEDSDSDEDYESTESEYSEEDMSVDNSVVDFHVKMPNRIVHLKADKNLKFKPDKQLFNILNNKIKGIREIKDKDQKLLYQKIEEMNKVVNKIDNHISESINNSNENMFDNIIKFVLDSNNNNNKTTIEFLCELNEYLIPTSILICGQNVSDRSLHFKHLENKLKTSINPSPLIFRFNEECINKINNINSQKKVIIIIDSIEQWSTKILTLLIHTLHNNNNKEFILIIGVSTDQYLIQEMIEPNALKLLAKSQYYFESSNHLYLNLAEEILIEKSPILFNEKILNELINNSKLNNFSINRFQDEIRYLFMSYFVDSDINKYIKNIKKFTKIYNTYRNALNVLKMITDHLNFNWSKPQIIGILQNKNFLFKNLLSILGTKDSNFNIEDEEKNNFPQRIDDFNECLKIFKILEQQTKSFDKTFAANVFEQYTIITNKLEQKQSNQIKQPKSKKANAKKQRKQLKRQCYSGTNKQVYSDARKKIFELLRTFIGKNLQPMNELSLNEIFVYSNDNQFSNHIYSPSYDQFRKRFEKYTQFFEDSNYNSNPIASEPMCCIYDIYKETDGLYINLHDAYTSFKHTFDLEDNEMSTDDSDDSDDDQLDYGNRKISEKEATNQIQFRMSIDDLLFCGFVKPSRKKQLLMKMGDHW